MTVFPRLFQPSRGAHPNHLHGMMLQASHPGTFRKASLLATLLDPWSRLNERDSYWPPSPTWKAGAPENTAKAKSVTWWEIGSFGSCKCVGLIDGLFNGLFWGGSSVWLWFLWFVLLRISNIYWRIDHESITKFVFSPNKNQATGAW